ncbi:MAG: hypothetical protein KGH55_02555 [Nanoarchaeota archaeon]|nr:hypothetical protein [Nanoarchaeota archaeon]
MSLFGKKDKTVDLTGQYDRQKERMENIRGLVNDAEGKTRNSMQQLQTQSSPAIPAKTQNSFGFLSSMASSAAQNSYSDAEDDGDEKKRKLAKRLVDLTERLEDLSTQIYHLQQRVELLERKTGSSGFE